MSSKYNKLQKKLILNKQIVNKNKRNPIVTIDYGKNKKVSNSFIDKIKRFIKRLF